MRQYLDVVSQVLRDGTRKANRTGVDTISTFNLNYEVDLEMGFPLLTTKKVSWKNIVVENLWFLSGEPHIEVLRKHGCKFWEPWADEDGLVPSAYGNFWRQFPVHDAEEGTWTDFDEECAPTNPRGWNDQLAWAVNELRRNPMSRRVVVTAWAPGNAQTSSLPPCHVTMVFNVQNVVKSCSDCDPRYKVDPYCDRCGGYGVLEHRLCLHLTQRSCDIALGVPYNLAGYAFILELMSRFTGIKAGIFAHTLVDAHIYTAKPDGGKAEYDHVPGLREQLCRDPRQLPRLHIDSSVKNLRDIDRLLDLGTRDLMDHFVLEGYDPHPAIRFKVAV